MEENKGLKRAIYIVIAILVLLFFTKDIDFSHEHFYENIELIKEPEQILVLVNKNHQLPADYIPNDLVLLDVNYANADKYLRQVAKDAFENLSRDAKNLGYSIVAVSAYRDYFYQERLYNQYVEEKGLEYADRCSARPGHSEHQTGLALDVMGSNQDYDEFEKSDEFDWMKENAYKYGFIMRYPKNKEKITGFKYEPWHYRYVGLSVAKTIYDNQWTLEEYLKNQKK